jgi:arylsulfatase A
MEERDGERRRVCRFMSAIGAVLLLALSLAAPAADKPNIIYILCDDLGYGDVSCLNPNGKIKTPHMDRLAREGMIFTDAHSGSSVCTPTRYGVVTGRYAWRTKLQSAVLGGLSPRLIEQGRLTVADFLKQSGYHTAAIGKWHLGMDWAVLPGKEVTELSIEPREQVWNVDYSKPIKNGPNAVGFDYYFGISASLDMVPYTFIENDRVTALPTEDIEFLLYEGREGRYCRKGPTAPGFHTSHVLPAFRDKAVQYISARAADAKSGNPFFLYLPLNSPHTPIAPSPEWQGKSRISFYADFTMETDAALGTILAALDQHGLARDTLIVLTSDNGCSPSADYPELIGKGHNPSHVFRGHKADVFDGGHRVPFLVRWPARVKAGGRSDQTLCQTDLFATAADILGQKVPANAAEDSVSFLPALLGTDQQPLREATVHHSINGSFVIRQGQWKLALCPGSGGWSAPRPIQDDASKLPLVQLYDLRADIGETTNVQDQHPEVVARLTKLLEKYVADGRSTPGPKQANAMPVDIWKAGKAAHQPLAAKKAKKAKKK